MPGDNGRKSGKEGRLCKENQQRKNIEAESEERIALAMKNNKKQELKDFARHTINNRDQAGSQEKTSNKDASARNQQNQRPPTVVSSEQKNTKNNANKTQSKRSNKTKAPIYGALDLGTNNCRLLLARPNRQGFQIVDAFSRIIRLGEGVSETNSLSKDAMARTIDALQVCSAKLAFHKVNRARLVATQACRAAGNSSQFLATVKKETGLNLEIICQETEAKLAVSGCVPLINNNCDYALIFDIGGGSSELIWIDIQKIQCDGDNNYVHADEAIVSWISLPIGVVTLAEKFGGKHVDQAVFNGMVSYVKTLLKDFAKYIDETTNINQSNTHYLGTSGTVTTLAGVHLSLETYDRQKIDGIWMHTEEVSNVSKRLINLSFAERSAIPSIGKERADLVMGGCAILEAMLETWPTTQLRVADRGLREGILAKLMSEDGFIKPGQSWRSQPKRSHNYKKKAQHASNYVNRPHTKDQARKP